MRAKAFQPLLVLLVAACDKGPPGVAGPSGPQGTTGDKGAPADAMLSWLLPTEAYLDRTVAAQISGAGTHFGPLTRLDFGDAGISTQSQVVASTGFVEARVRISAQSRLGAHDVTAVTPMVGDGGGEERAVLKGAFLIRAALAADDSGNTKMAVQGGVMEFSAMNLDRDHPLSGSGQLRGGAHALHLSIYANHAFGTGIVDALAPVGALPLTLVTLGVDSNQQTTLTYSFDPIDAGAPGVVARTATPLVPGQDWLGEQFAGPQQTAFYKLSSTMDEQVLALTARTSGPLSSVLLCGALAGATGRFSEGQFLYASANGATQTLVGLMPTAGDNYVSILPANLNGGAMYAFDLQPRAAVARRISTKEAMPDTPAQPLVDIGLDGPVYSTDGAFDDALDVDYLRIKTAKDGRLYVAVTTDGLHLSNPATSVALMQADCKTVVTAAQPVQQEAPASAGGTLCARISTPAGAVGPYTLVVTQGL